MQRGVLIQYAVALALSLATVTMGVTSGWVTPVIPKFKNNETNFRMNEDQISWMVAMAAPGFTLGSLITRFTCDTFGRRATILASALPIGMGMGIAATAQVAWLLYLMRLLWGMGTGMISTVLSIYLAEIADKDIRGSLSVITRVGFNTGLFVMMCSSFVSYELLNYSLLTLPPCFFFFCLWIPESPYYYLKEGKVRQARRALCRLRDNAEVAEAELEKLKADVNKEMRHSSTVSELFTGRQYRRAIIISSGLKVAQILTGALTIQQYFGSIIQESQTMSQTTNQTTSQTMSQTTSQTTSTALIIFGVVKFFVGIASSALADKVGRRPLVIYSFLGNGLSLAIVAVYFFFVQLLNVDKSVLVYFKFIPLVGIITSDVVSTLGFNSIIGIIQAEIFPLNIKSVAMTCLNIFGGFLGFLVGKGYQDVHNVVGVYGVFSTFAGISVGGAVFSFFYLPETKGKSLKEIQDIIQGVTQNVDVPDEKQDIQLTEMKRLNAGDVRISTAET